MTNSCNWHSRITFCLVSGIRWWIYKHGGCLRSRWHTGAPPLVYSGVAMELGGGTQLVRVEVADSGAVCGALSFPHQCGTRVGGASGNLRTIIVLCIKNMLTNIALLA